MEWILEATSTVWHVGTHFDPLDELVWKIVVYPYVARMATTTTYLTPLLKNSREQTLLAAQDEHDLFSSVHSVGPIWRGGHTVGTIVAAVFNIASILSDVGNAAAGGLRG